MRYTVAVDFDGVLHSYTSGWQGPTVIPDPPVPGAFSWMQEMLEHYDVMIYSSRLPMAEMQMYEWFRQHGGGDVVTHPAFKVWLGPGKPAALIYVDDRGFRFEGVFPTLEQIRAKPWTVGS